MGRLTLPIVTLTVLVIGCAQKQAVPPQPQANLPAPTKISAVEEGLIAADRIGAIAEVGCLPEPSDAPVKPEPAGQPQTATTAPAPATAPQLDQPTDGPGRIFVTGPPPMAGEGAARSPAPSFFGMACPPAPRGCDIVYLIDRSGSMLDTLDPVRAELLRSVARLKPHYRFHVIFFAAGPPQENPPGKLVYARNEQKVEAAKYLETVQPRGQTDPIPALQRAFEVLKDERKGNAKAAGKVIFLLTDGEFFDNDKVVAAAKSLNPDKTVKVNTILHVHKSPAAEKVLTEIAEDSGGTFKFVPERD